MGVGRVFWGGTLDQHFPLLLDLDVCLLTLGRGRGTEEMVHVGVPWGVGGVPGVEADVEADVEAVDQDDGFQDEVGVSLECTVEAGGCAAGSHGRRKGPLRVREVEWAALVLWGSGVAGCLAGNMDHLGGRTGCLERKDHHCGGAHCGNARGPPGNAGHLGKGANPQGEEGEVDRGHTADHRDETWICVDGRGPPSH